jgi:hypothetical protein
MIEEWATTGGLISDTKVDYLCRCIIPLVLCHAGIPKNHDVWATIPKDARDVQRIVSAAANMPQPVLVSREVCRQCHHRREGQDTCPRCPGKRVPVPGKKNKKKIVGTSDWGMESVYIWNVEDLIDDWLQVREIALNLFNHSKDDGVKNRSLDAQRGRFWRKFMDGMSNGEQRALLMAYHNDGFAPLKSRPNDFSLTYGILSLVLGPKVIRLL